MNFFDRITLLVILIVQSSALGIGALALSMGLVYTTGLFGYLHPDPRPTLAITAGICVVVGYGAGLVASFFAQEGDGRSDRDRPYK